MPRSDPVCRDARRRGRGLALALLCALFVVDRAAVAQPPVGPSIGKQVVDVRIVGNRTVAQAKVRAALTTRPGQPFDPIKVQRDVRSLTETGKFFDVKIKTLPGPHPASVIVIFEVFEFPRLEYIRYIGNRTIRTKALEKQAALSVGDPLDPIAVEAGARKIKDFYKSRGYNKIRIDIREGLKQTDRGAVFFVSEGPQQKIWSVRFEGNTIVSDGRLKTQIQSKPSPIKYVPIISRGYVERKKIEEDVNRLTAYYRSLGYFRARVGRELDYDRDGNWLTLTFVIDEGPRFGVRSISFAGNRIFTADQLQSILALKPGEPFDQAKMSKDLASLTEAYGAVGHILADVQASPRTLEREPMLDLVYDIDEGNRYYIHRINVKIGGENPHTRHSVALNRLSFQPGEIADLRKARESETRLRASGLFASNPAQGVRPRVVIRPLKDKTQIASRDSRPTSVRGQSPDGPHSGYRYPPPAPPSVGTGRHPGSASDRGRWP